MSNSVIVINKKVRFDYNLIKEYDAGIILEGWEIKSLREKNVVLKDAFVIFKKHRPFIINLYIKPYIFSNNSFVNLNPERTRELLLNKHEIKDIENQIKLEKVIVIPTKLFYKNNLAKVKIYTAKAKKNYDKRADLKEKDLKRELSKNYNYKN